MFSVKHYLEKECSKLDLKTPYGATKSAVEILEKERKYLIEAKPFFEVAEIVKLHRKKKNDTIKQPIN